MLPLPSPLDCVYVYVTLNIFTDTVRWRYVITLSCAEQMFAMIKHTHTHIRSQYCVFSLVMGMKKNFLHVRVSLINLPINAQIISACAQIFRSNIIPRKQSHRLKLL